MLIIKRKFSKVLVFILAVLISFTCGTFKINSNAFLVEAVEGHIVQYVKGQIVFGSPYSWDNENIQLVATQLPEYSVKPMFESEGVNTYLITLNDASKNDEAVKLLQSVPDTVFAVTNYFYSNDTDAILQMQESDNYHKGDVMKMGIHEVAEFDVSVEKEVGGNLVNIPLCADLVVLKDGVFYSIEEAYEQNILSAKEIGIANSIYKTSIATMELNLA